MLSSTQRTQLNQSIIGYLQAQIGEEAAQPVAKALQVKSVPPDMRNRLELKWKALVHLQHRIQDLERDLEAAKRATPKKENGLPSEPLFTLDEHSNNVTCVAIHPRWTLIASGCIDGSVKLWNSELGQRQKTLLAHTLGVTGLDFGKDVLVSCSSDMSIRLFDTQEFELQKTLVGHEHTVSAVKLFANDTQLASCARDHSIRIWDTKTGFCTRVIDSHTEWIRCLGAPEGAIVSAGHDLVVRITSVGVGSAGESSAFSGHDNAIDCCAIAPESADANIAKLAGLSRPVVSAYKFNYFATGARDKKIILWSSRTGAIKTLVGHDNWVRGLWFHPDGRFLISVGDDKTMRIWDLANDAQLYNTIKAHEHFVTCIAGRGSLVVTGSVDHTVRVW